MSFIPEMEEYVEFLGDPRYKSWSQFKEVLGAISEHPDCPGCQQNGGNPDCKVRVCVRERELAFCYKCSDFPCGKLLAKSSRKWYSCYIIPIMKEADVNDSKTIRKYEQAHSSTISSISGIIVSIGILLLVLI